MRVLDFGAGRGAWREDECDYRRRLRSLRDKVKQLVACDIDQAVDENREAHQSDLLLPGERLPYKDASFDMVLMDYVLEHLTAPEATVREVMRVLKPGGWLCCRTPNRRHYVSIVSRLIPERMQKRIVKAAQPDRN
jgi:ubiquinone/menaquinone biosynthesis C-methylase UbiE